MNILISETALNAAAEIRAVQREKIRRQERVINTQAHTIRQLTEQRDSIKQQLRLIKGVSQSQIDQVVFLDRVKRAAKTLGVWRDILNAIDE